VIEPLAHVVVEDLVTVAALVAGQENDTGSLLGRYEVPDRPFPSATTSVTSSTVVSTSTPSVTGAGVSSSTVVTAASRPSATGATVGVENASTIDTSTASATTLAVLDADGLLVASGVRRSLRTDAARRTFGPIIVPGARFAHGQQEAFRSVLTGAVVNGTLSRGQTGRGTVARNQRVVPGQKSSSADCSAAASTSSQVCHDARAQPGSEPWSRTYSRRNVLVFGSLG
jgi:hypothetical protein